MQLDDILFDYDEWKKKEPSVAQKITSMIARPAEWLINPIIDKIHPILEETLKKSNAKIADIIHTTADELENPLEMKEEDFLKWMETQDESVDRWITGGIASISAEGTASGFIGLAGLLTEIPISFGTILFFANKIAFQYYLNITDEQTNLEVLKAISAGSAASLESKKDCISGFESTSSTLHKDTWKSLTKSTEGLHHSVFIARSVLETLGINISRRKVSQILPGLGAVAGGVINGVWASEALNSVKYYSRYLILKNYLELNNPSYYNFYINK